jgi:hypothetical protein
MRADLGTALNTSLTSDSKLHIDNVISVLGPTDYFEDVINKQINFIIFQSHTC